MLRLGSALRRPCGRCIPSVSYTTTAEYPFLHHTVRVENLPEGYNVGSIIDTVKANPSETITPSKNHLLVRFFDERTAKCCVEENKEEKLSLKIDDSTSPALDVQTVAVLAKYNATRTVQLRKLPESFTESQFNDILSEHGGVVSLRFDKTRGVTEAQFLDLHQASKARAEFVRAGAVPRFVDTDHFIYPEWYSKQDEQPNQERLVKIEGLEDVETRQICMRWTNNYNDFPLASFISACHTSEKEMWVYFPTSALARQFMSICDPMAKGKCTMTLQTTDQAVSRGIVTAIDLGARRLVSFPFNGKLSDEKRQTFGRFFHRFGRLDTRRITHTEGQLIVPFATVVGASSFIYHARQGLRTKSPVELNDVLPTFVGAHHSR
ncbi:uncharacterized protein EV420DRAFT_738935 [Desarmillaria tabescens]|uniref:RRM domain-containing protein n=1 Tax=Armillaria tabescens TaxID=1929756 RepID=A0AA39MXS1_ARMTA|nr:uncharacterized protein EV420DRAFT_738935 [Desarmillaria tabescens]KAK0450542.1 hypothetical protein EV420DRAFT_738935 [Desarmillaria tabescens]